MRVRAPATIANLGPGFDVLALAVDLWLEVEATPAAEPSWTFVGEGAEFLSRHANPLSELPMRGEVRCSIPMGVGLGSSAAARLAAAALRAEADPLASAIAAEGHPDNAAAAFHGGVVMVVDGICHHLPTPDLELALLVANEPVATERAREALPQLVPLADAALNAGRLALMVQAFHTREYDLLRHATRDLLHQPYRQWLYPWTSDARLAAEDAGAFGAAVCGAGPSVFAFCRPGSARAVAAAMAEAAPQAGRPLVAGICPSGLEVIQ